MHFRDQWEVQKATVVLLACDLTANAFLQVGCFVCFLSHFFEPPSIKEKMTFCCFRSAGGFIWSCREVPLHAPVTKLCRMSGAGACMQQQCKACCIYQLPIMLPEVLPAIRKENLPTDAFYPVWATSPPWWALLRFLKPAFSCFFLRFFPGFYAFEEISESCATGCWIILIIPAL